jgi:PH domain
VRKRQQIMQEPFSSLPSAPPPDAAVVYQGIVPDVRSAASTDGFPSSDQSIVSVMSGSIAGDASVASEVLVLPSPTASSVEQQQQQQRIPAIEPHNPFFENLSIVTSARTAPPAAAPSLAAASVSSEAPYGIISPAHSNTKNPAAQIIPAVLPAQPPPPRTTAQQPSITARSSEAGEDDEDTAPSSTGRGPLMLPTDAISRLIETTKRFLQRKDSEDDDEETRQGVLISGYLQKLGRNGKWQTRWFETDGECLSYYKNQKRSKLLATLELQKVGSILWPRLHTNVMSAKRPIIHRLTTTNNNNALSFFSSS